MPGKMSNRDRIARMAAEAEAVRKEKAAAQARPSLGKPAAKPRPKQPAGRVKVVWVVCDQAGREVQRYPYPEAEAARNDAQQRTASSGRPHFVKDAEVPFA